MKYKLIVESAKSKNLLLGISQKIAEMFVIYDKIESKTILELNDLLKKYINLAKSIFRGLNDISNKYVIFVKPLKNTIYLLTKKLKEKINKKFITQSSNFKLLLNQVSDLIKPIEYENLSLPKNLLKVQEKIESLIKAWDERIDVISKLKKSKNKEKINNLLKINKKVQNKLDNYSNIDFFVLIAKEITVKTEESFKK